MSYVINPPTYEAIQWNGSNVAECEAFFLAWFPQPAPPLPPPAPQPSSPFAYYPTTQTITISPGYALNVGDWMVNGGTWSLDSTWAGAPEVVTNVVFQAKYVPDGES